MAGKVRTFLRDQPFLAGCLGVLVALALLCGGVVALGAIGVGSCVSCMGQGLDSFPATTSDAMEAGYALGVNINNSEVTYSLEPMDAREVTCADLEAILFPHLTGELETVRITSTSYRVSPTGELSSMPVTCTYSGYPGSGGATPPPTP